MEKHCNQSEWGYIKNNRAGGDCHLVAVANAYRYFTGESVGDDLYDKLVDQTGCRHGSVINIEPAHEALGIKEKKWWSSWREFWSECYDTGKQVLIDNLPLAITVSHPKYGNHFILAVDYNKEVNAVKVYNFECGPTSSGRWIFFSDLNTYASVADQFNLGTRRVVAYIREGSLDQGRN